MIIMTIMSGWNMLEMATVQSSSSELGSPGRRGKVGQERDEQCVICWALTLCQTLYFPVFSQGMVGVPILQMRKLYLRKVISFMQNKAGRQVWKSDFCLQNSCSRLWGPWGLCAILFHSSSARFASIYSPGAKMGNSRAKLRVGS